MIDVDRIYNIDVLEGLRKLPDNSIDLIITSPPYNKGYYTKNRRVDVYTVGKKVRNPSTSGCKLAIEIPIAAQKVAGKKGGKAKKEPFPTQLPPTLNSHGTA